MLLDVTLQRDARWANAIGGLTLDGQVLPFTIAALEAAVADWATIVEDLRPCGSLALLDTARAMVVQSYFRYDLLVQASLTALQAVETAYRDELYPEASKKLAFQKLVKRSEREGYFDASQAAAISAGVQIRNWLSHPDGLTAFSLGMAAGYIRPSHYIVRDVCLAGVARGRPSEGRS